MITLMIIDSWGGTAFMILLFTAGLEAAESMGAIGPKVVLFMLPFAVAMILLAARMLVVRRGAFNGVGHRIRVPDWTANTGF